MLTTIHFRQALAILTLSWSVEIANASPLHQQKIFLDEMRKLDWTAPHPTTVILIDSSSATARGSCLSQVERFDQDRREKSRSNMEAYLHLGSDWRGYSACQVRGEITKTCINQLNERPLQSELVLVVKDRHLDSGMQMGSLMGPNGVNINSSMYLEYRRSAEVFMVERGSGRLLYHARLVGSAATLEGAEHSLCKEVSERLANVFNPDLGRKFPRQRIGANPLGILFAARGNQLLQGTYERLIGDGQVSLFWAPAYLYFKNEDRILDYLHLPFFGLRYYQGLEGRGWWIGAKVGYARLNQAEFEETFEAHTAFLMAEVGRSWHIQPFFVYANVDAGAAMGWKKEGWRQYGWGYKPPPDDLESGFDVHPILEAALGIGYAF